MSAYKAHRLHVAWIQFLTGIYTLWYSLAIITVALFRNNKRQRITNITRRWAYKLLAPTGLVIKVDGAENLQQQEGQAVIVMCNHSSLYDIPVSFLALDVDLRMLAKKELFKIPFLSSALTQGDFVAIDRSNIQQAKKDLRKAEEKLKQGIVLWIAPEGTRSKDGQLRRFKKGGFHLAIDTRALIVPVAIRGLDRILPSHSYDLSINGVVEVSIGKAIDASGYTKTDYRVLLETTRSAMTELLGAHDHDD